MSLLFNVRWICWMYFQSFELVIMFLPRPYNTIHCIKQTNVPASCWNGWRAEYQRKGLFCKLHSSSMTSALSVLLILFISTVCFSVTLGTYFFSSKFVQNVRSESCIEPLYRRYLHHYEGSNLEYTMKEHKIYVTVWQL